MEFKTRIVDSLQVQIHENRAQMGRAAGEAAAQVLRDALQKNGEARCIFAAAPSQDECLHTLRCATGIDFSKVTAFHMDEYLALPESAPQRFGNYLKSHLFDHLAFGNVHFLAPDGGAPETLCESYAELLREKPIDLVCMGIGENGHIAFNDPPVADFADPKLVKIVALDEACRRQQVNDGCFPRFEDVPTHAITLTIPALLSGKHLICTVPGKRKHDAVRRTLHGPIETACPASILRTHPHTIMFLDPDSAGEWNRF